MRRRLPRAVRALELQEAMASAQGDTERAASILGISRASLYARAARAGIRLVPLRDATDAPPVGDARLDADAETVTLPKATYLSLVAQAASAGHIYTEGERVIAVLTRQVQELAAQCGATA